jgi:hypothetical protein
MKRISPLWILVGALMLMGSECNQELFPAVMCEDSQDCTDPCEEFCADGVESATCDANDLCECICAKADDDSSLWLDDADAGIWP